MLKPIRSVGILGAGTMGCGIALISALHNFEVVLWDRKNEDIVKERLQQNKIYANINTETNGQFINKIHITKNMSEMSSVDLVLECVSENIDVKKKIFKKISHICEKKIIFATNTSSLSVKELAMATDRAEQFIGLHFFNPLNKIALVEVVKTEMSLDSVISIALDFIKSLDKTPIVVKDSPGFVVNRLLFFMIDDACRMVEEGLAKKEDIDNAMILGANFPIGPFALADLVGLDVTYEIINNLYKKVPKNRIMPNNLLKNLVRRGKFGRKTKEGFYNYF